MKEALKIKLQEIEDKLIEHQFPPQLVIENTSSCDQQCLHCSHKELIRPKKHMKRELWNKIVEEVGSIAPDTEIWPTFYGEALVMGDEIWDRIDYAASVGCRNIVLNSNGGLLLRKNHINRILNSPLKRFILSIDGYSKETYEKIRFLGERDRTYNAVETLLDEHKKRNQIYPLIVCQFSLMEENQHELEAFRDHWKNKGAEVKVRPKLEWTSSGSIKASNIDHQTKFRIACPWGNNTMAIHQDGSVVACAVDYEGRHKVGNAGEKTVKQLWKRLGETLRTYHKNHDWSNVPEVCKNCGDWQTAGAEYEEKDVPDGARPFWFNKETTNYKMSIE